MKTIGLLGATSFGSNFKYIEVINKTVGYALGGQHTANCIHYSFDFHEIERLLSSCQWGRLRSITVGAAVTLEKAGADFIVLCSNVLHIFFAEIVKEIHIPILHVVEVVADELVENGVETLGVIGTKNVMTLDYHEEILRRRGIEPIVPPEADMDLLNAIIYDELCRGVVREQSKREVLRIIDALCKRGADGVALACTEISMLVRQTDTDAPLFDTTPIHAERAALIAVRDEVLA